MRQFLIALAFTLLLVQGAHSDSVHILAASGRSGEGWLYADGKQCFALTPRHVILVDGKLIAPLLVDADGVQGVGVAPEVPPATMTVAGTAMDIARMRVVGALARRCSDDLGYDDLDATLDRILGSSAQLYFEKVGESGSSEQIPVEIVAINKDHERFTIRTTDPDSDPVRESDSGSVVRLRGASLTEVGLPLGLVLSDEGGGYISVLRLDAVRRWLDGMAREPNPKADTMASVLSDWSGQTPDPGCGPTNLFDPDAACGWRPIPRPGLSYVGLDLLAASGHAEWLDGVTVEVEARSSLASLEVLVPSSATNSWESIRFCVFGSASRTLTCNFLPRQVLAVRIRLGGVVGGIKKLRLLKETLP